MPKRKDLTGKRFGKLIVLEQVDNDKFGKSRYLCKCDCGSEPKIINASSLIRGLTTSCGCKKLELIVKRNEEAVINEVGNVYGYLTVIDRNTDPKFAKDGRAMWNCVCECGNSCVVMGKLLRIGNVTSCGCRKKSQGEEKIEEILIKNNITYAKEYFVMIQKDGINYQSRFDFAIFENNNLSHFVEYDGEQHFEKNIQNGYMFNKEAFEKTKERDLRKNQWCIDNNIPLIRIPYTHLKFIELNDLLLNSKFKILS